VGGLGGGGGLVLGFGAWDLGFGVPGSGCRVSGFGRRVSGVLRCKGRLELGANQGVPVAISCKRIWTSKREFRLVNGKNLD